VESIASGPVEAITATGANRLQTIVFAVIPQIIPPYIAFAFYRWDINVRMSTIIGFVGGGGVGFVLAQYIGQLRYQQASVMMLSIAIVVATLDYFSSRVRSRII
jgi:phosphonate transport system permease protein